MTPPTIHSLMAAFAPFEPRPHIAVAVSGGPDSMATVIALHHWTQAHQGRLTAFHVDHRLRPTSTEEAQTIQKWLMALGIDCHILTWEHPPLTSSLMSRARHARYDLLLDACRTRRILHLALGHHRDDDYETIDMRQEKKSGAAGLAGMSACVETPHTRLLRPFLSLSKAELRPFLGDHPTLTDPSNMDPRFARGRLRATNSRLKTSNVMLLKQKRLEGERALVPLVVDHVTIHPQGYGTVTSALLKTAPTGLLVEIVRRLIRTIGGLNYLPSPRACHRLLVPFTDRFHHATLGNCILTFSKEGLTVTRELRSCHSHPITSSTPFLWDKRFFVDHLPLNALDLGMKLNYLGREGFLAVRSLYPSSLPMWVGMTLPAIWRKGHVVHPFFTTEALDSPPVCLRFQPRQPLLEGHFLSPTYRGKD